MYVEMTHKISKCSFFSEKKSIFVLCICNKINALNLLKFYNDFCKNKAGKP